MPNLKAANSYNKAIANFSNSKYTNAMYHFKDSLSHAEHNDAMYHLGLMYELGLGTKDNQANNERALVYYYQAFSNGHPLAGKCFARKYNDMAPNINYFTHKYPEFNFQQAYSEFAALQ